VVKGPNCSVRLREKAIVVPQNSIANIPIIVFEFSGETDIFKLHLSHTFKLINYLSGQLIYSFYVNKYLIARKLFI